DHVRAAHARGEFSNRGPVAGFELEAWLVDRQFRPAPDNLSFIDRLGSPLVVPELSRFNVEFNGTPQVLQGGALTRLENELLSTWRQAQEVAADGDTSLVAIGTLPTLREADLSLANMTPLRRYALLNRQVLQCRDGRPLRLSISGIEELSTMHADVMLEAAATSFQVHLQMPAREVVRAYNASLLLAAPLVALAANSPLLFGKTLWHETRIPLFEQSVDCCHPDFPGCRRVTFGTGYLVDPTDDFVVNLQRYQVLLPFILPEAPSAYAHLRLHNGTVWRWVRMLIGFDDDSAPHFRIEQRVMPAGPSLIDMIANAAFYYGAVYGLARQPVPPESGLSFDQIRDNFYRAARDGLAAPLLWLDGRRRSAADLLKHQLLPLAAEGLAELQLDAGDRERYLAVIADRLRCRRNGALWQLTHFARHGDLNRLTADYIDQQSRLHPVHEWPL
ncbi:MAG TPA: glutamate-cysteine ligase family protein, partial [Accumulibacter sp.]|nr:glutamate-cysteine ligase family protein [Accumulibacter sp.]